MCYKNIRREVWLARLMRVWIQFHGALCARNAHITVYDNAHNAHNAHITVYDVTTWSWRQSHFHRGLWSRNETACAHAQKIRKWRPAQRQQPGSAVDVFIDCGKVNWKMQSGRKDQRCGKYQFCSKITVSTYTAVTVICVPREMCAPKHISLVISVPQTDITWVRGFPLQKHQ